MKGKKKAVEDEDQATKSSIDESEKNGKTEIKKPNLEIEIEQPSYYDEDKVPKEEENLLEDEPLNQDEELKVDNPIENDID